MSNPEQRKIDEQKRIFDAITRAWLDDKYRDFGRFTFKAIMALIFILVMKLVFALHYSDLRNALESATQIQELAR